MLTFLAMDFSRAGAVQALPDAFRARVRWRQDGHRRESLSVEIVDRKVRRQAPYLRTVPRTAVLDTNHSPRLSPVNSLATHPSRVFDRRAEPLTAQLKKVQFGNGWPVVCATNFFNALFKLARYLARTGVDDCRSTRLTCSSFTPSTIDSA